MRWQNGQSSSSNMMRTAVLPCWRAVARSDLKSPRLWSKKYCWGSRTSAWPATLNNNSITASHALPISPPHAYFFELFKNHGATIDGGDGCAVSQYSFLDGATAWP